MTEKNAKRTTRVHIGTSGWMYKDWGERFYPQGMKRGFLTFLSNEFNSVEVNSSFYHLPKRETFEKWHAETPDTFVFAVKMSRYITHRRRLVDVREPICRFLENAQGLREKLGIVLIQLPPNLKYNEDVLRAFLDDLRAAQKEMRVRTRFALEPRHVSWMESASSVRKHLQKQNMALVFPHSANIPSFDPSAENELTDFVYVRFHGPSEFASSSYGPTRLEPWAKRIRTWRRKKFRVFVYFNNDVHGHAIDDARTLKDLV